MIINQPNPFRNCILCGDNVPKHYPIGFCPHCHPVKKKGGKTKRK